MSLVCSLRSSKILNVSSACLVDGAGLACGIFEYLLSLGDERPKVLAATHFHEIFENGFLPERRFLALRHMEVRIEEMISGAREEVTYLYKYVPFLS